LNSETTPRDLRGEKQGKARKSHPKVDEKPFRQHGPHKELVENEQNNAIKIKINNVRVRVG